MTLSSYPANRVCPSALHAKDNGIGSAPNPVSLVCLISSTTDLVSKSQILIPTEVAAQSQYLFGEKVSALIRSPASSEYKCLSSLRSQSIVTPSLPPEAQREPSGEIVIVDTYPE